MRRVLAILLAVLMMVSLAGCIVYASGRMELYVVALHSLLGVGGHPGDGVVILEEDDFGRVMFAFVGRTSASTWGEGFNILAVLIAQRSTRRYSYFYDGINSILHEVRMEHGWRHSGLSMEDFVLEYFTEEQLEQLKEENRWNEELSEGGFFRVRVSRRDKRDFMTRVSVETQREAFGLVSTEFPFGGGFTLTMDSTGNVIIFQRTSRDRRGFLFMFDGDGNLIEETGIMELTDLWDYRDQLREFKEANGWSFYYR